MQIHPAPIPWNLLNYMMEELGIHPWTESLWYFLTAATTNPISQSDWMDVKQMMTAILLQGIPGFLHATGLFRTEKFKMVRMPSYFTVEMGRISLMEL